jgi:phosphinothricin acetyltransferase
MSEGINIRLATGRDLKAMTEIYNQAIRSGNATADIEELNVEERVEWFGGYSDDRYPLYVIEVDNIITGWGSLSPYRKGRGALKSVAEISFYIHYDHHSKGYGTAIIEYMINDCKRLGFENLIALLLEINKASIAMLERHGFEKWGLMPDVVNLNGIRCGHLIYGRKV